MKRRQFGLLAGTSLLALKLGQGTARAAADPSLLTTTLTPLGGERAGNADGSIPAWTGGYTTLPAGWQPGQAMPDIFAGEQPVVVIDSSNMAQHADRLSEGVMAMMTKYGFSIKVFPTHRTASAPQSVYDYTAKNVTTASLLSKGPAFGFANAYGGIPFPIPDTSDPVVAGSQIMYNHLNRWAAYAFTGVVQGWAVNNGSPTLALQTNVSFDFPYYYKPDLGKTVSGREYGAFTGPAEINGGALCVLYPLNYAANATQAWELLTGQGRVRKAPELSFDTPSSFTDGIANYDEYYGFSGSIERYNWKVIEKKEFYIPYNNNAMFLVPAEDIHKPHFLDPEIVRWELHRVWVLEATLASGERNVVARRRMYIDEDTWVIGTADEYDGNNNLYKVNTVYNLLRPDVPGLIHVFLNSVNNLQTDDYCTPIGFWNQRANPSLTFHDSLPDSVFDPLTMAASSQY